MKFLCDNLCKNVEIISVIYNRFGNRKRVDKHSENVSRILFVKLCSLFPRPGETILALLPGLDTIFDVRYK